MAITLECTGCGGEIEVGDEYAGKQIRCGRCKALLTVPAASGRTEREGVTERPAATPAPPPLSPRRRRDWGDEEDEDLRRGRSVAKTGSFSGVLIAVIAAVVLLGVCGLRRSDRRCHLAVDAGAPRGGTGAAEGRDQGTTDRQGSSDEGGADRQEGRHQAADQGG